MGTTISLGFAQRPVRVDIEDLWVRPGAGSQELRFSLKLQAPWLADDSPNSHEVLTLRARIDGGAGYGLHSLGTASLMSLVRQFPTSEQLILVVTDEQLLGLESLRGQGAVDFQLDLVATLSREGARPGWAATQARDTVMPGRWEELLDQIGAAATITVRVPAPFSRPEQSDTLTLPSASQAAGRLRTAQQFFRDGNREACVQTCRSVLDNLRALDPPTSVSELNRLNPQSRNQSQRWSALLHDLYSLSSGALHDDEVTRDFTWSIEDAQDVLAMTAALLGWVRVQNM